MSDNALADLISRARETAEEADGHFTGRVAGSAEQCVPDCVEIIGELVAALEAVEIDCDDEAAAAPSDTISVKKAVGYIPVSHDVLCDFTDHECNPDCPPPFVPEPVPLLRRAWWRVRNAVRWVTGLRVAHKDRIDNDEQW